MGSAYRVLDLSPIDIPPRQVLNLLRCNLLRCAEFIDERGPDLLFRRLVEFTEVEGDMDTREESFVESLNPIGGQKQNPSIVLDVSKADHDQS